MTQLVWLRNDLRLTDNPALYGACQSLTNVRVIYCATPKQWQAHNLSGAQLGFCQDRLNEISGQLAARAIPLEVIEAPYYRDLAQEILAYCIKHQITGLWLNRQIGFNEQQRDQQVSQRLLAQGIEVHVFDNDLLVNTPMLTGTLAPYRVFTPWYKQWLTRLLSFDIQVQAAPQPHFANPSSLQRPTQQIETCQITLPGAQSYRSDLWPADEAIAVKRLQQFANSSATHNIFNYQQLRDYPGISGTSLLSPYLAVGVISIRQCYLAVMQACREQQYLIEENVWLKELGWREFYRYLMINNLAVSKGAAFNPGKETRWLQSEELLAAWQQGRTGFPIIDAAMLQLTRTGWMHNRLRMLTASFLCKLLLIDWRQGEAHFMRHLIDADFASNNGGWQWSSATGCDASPWFRIFNPTSQSQKFDNQGQFIRKMLPQLSSLSDKDIHCPSSAQRKALNYCEPIIDYSSCRQRALQWHKTSIS